LSELDGGSWSASYPGRREDAPVPLGQKAPQPVLMRLEREKFSQLPLPET